MTTWAMGRGAVPREHVPRADASWVVPALGVPVAVVAGALAVFAPPGGVVAGLAALAIAVVALWRPALSALVMIVLVAVVPRGQLFQYSVPFLGGGLKPTDVLLAITLGAWAITAALRRGEQRLPSPGFLLLLGGFLLLALLSIFLSPVAGSHKLGLLELRPLLSLLLVVPIVGDVRSRREVELGLYAILAASVVVSATTLVDFVQGHGASATFSGGATRVVGPVFLYSVMALIWTVVLLSHGGSSRRRTLLLVVGAFNVGALFFTYQRGAWIAALAGLIAVAAVLPGTRRTRALGYLAAGAAVAIVIVVAINAASPVGTKSPLAGALERISSSGDYNSDVSARYRFAEWQAASHEIHTHPLTGIGLGSAITFWSPMYSNITHQLGGSYSTVYIHNSYVWLALKTGLPAAALFLALVLSCVLSAYRGFRRARDPGLQALLLGVWATLFAALVLALTGPHLTTDSSTPYLAGAIAAVLLLTRREGLER
jgi:O-antigen ligase